MKTKYIKPELRVVNVAPQSILTISDKYDYDLELQLYLDQISDEEEY